jgi:uncharacterized protein YaaN involved in tellurite resistance
MPDDLRRRAEAELAEAETLLASALPDPLRPASDDAKADAEARRAAVERRKAEIDLSSTQSIVAFGSNAQAELTAISSEMLEGVRAKDAGPAGHALTRLVGALRGFDPSELDPKRKRGWWDRLRRRASPVADFINKYEEVRVQIDAIAEELLRHESQLLKDVKLLDRLYEKTLAFYDELGLYIAAGEARLRELDEADIPARERETTAAGEDEAGFAAQRLRDLRAARDDLERRVHDMKLTRQVTMQSLPSIRLVQENDKSLVGKIKSTLVNTVPLWETQLAQAVTVARSRDAARASRQASDLTNELLAKNAEQLSQANREVRTEMERGVFDIQAVKEANARLVATIDESLAIADEGRRRRAAAETELARMEAELRDALSSARARVAPPRER